MFTAKSPAMSGKAPEERLVTVNAHIYRIASKKWASQGDCQLAVVATPSIKEPKRYRIVVQSKPPGTVHANFFCTTQIKGRLTDPHFFEIIDPADEPFGVRFKQTEEADKFAGMFAKLIYACQNGKGASPPSAASDRKKPAPAAQGSSAAGPSASASNKVCACIWFAVPDPHSAL